MRYRCWSNSHKIHGELEVPRSMAEHGGRKAEILDDVTYHGHTLKKGAVLGVTENSFADEDRLLHLHRPRNRCRFRRPATDRVGVGGRKENPVLHIN